MVILKDRLLERAKETGMGSKEIEKRLTRAQKEMEISSRYDFCIVNYENRLDQAVDEIIKIIKNRSSWSVH